ncbi:MAG: ATP synthase F1 subunit epsilon [Treponema sp.]|nr:ATP synthase F1 subunit epsilon [Treponema sp.]
MKAFKFELYTPYRRFFSGEIEAITLTLPDGDITIYADHSFLTAPVQTGILKIKTKNGEWKNAFIADGILEVKAHGTIIMADAAEWPEEIDQERAEKAFAAAQEVMETGTFKFETSSAESACRRAKFRLKVKELN